MFASLLAVSAFADPARAFPGPSAEEWTWEQDSRVITVWLEPGRVVLHDLTLHGKGPSVRAACSVQGDRCVVDVLWAGPSLNDRVFVPVERARWAAGVAGSSGIALSAGGALVIDITRTCEDGEAARQLCVGEACVTLVSPVRPRPPGPPFTFRRLRCAEDTSPRSR